jgi:cell division protein FtsL
VKDDHNRWNKLAWDEHREFRSESRMRFSRLEESTSRLEKSLEDAMDEHREFRRESRMRFSRLEESTSRLEESTSRLEKMLLMGMGFLSVLVLVFFLDYRRTWRTISTDIGQLRSMVETICKDIDIDELHSRDYG